MRDPELSALEQFDRNLDGFLRFVDAHAAGYLAVANARGSEPRVQQLVERAPRAGASTSWWRWPRCSGTSARA